MTAKDNHDERAFILKIPADLHRVIKIASVNMEITMHDLIIHTLKKAFLKDPAATDSANKAEERDKRS